MPDKPNDDLFINFSVTVGPKFFEGHKHDTNEEIAEVLKSYAAHHEGVLREMFMILGTYWGQLKLNPLVELPQEGAQNATGPCNVQVGLCGGCKTDKGKDGYQTYVNGTLQEGCTAC